MLLGLSAACTEPPPPPDFSEPTPLPLAAGPKAEGPRLSVGPAGQLALSWMERNELGGTLKFTTLDNGRWQDAVEVVTDPGMFVNWADIPSVVPLSGENWQAHWLSKSAPSTYAYDVKVSHSNDSGATWSAPMSPHDDGTPTEHGFVSIARDGDHTHLLWLDGRDTANDTTDNPLDTSMTLRSASMDVDGTVRQEQLIDDSVCECCRTDMATTSTGRIAVYRNRTREEIRDIYVTRQIEGDWQTSVPISDDSWKIAGCPVNGPAIVAQGDLVAVAWFTAANNQPIVQARISTDAGLSFGDPILISRLNVIGQVDIEILNENAIAVSWLEKGRRALVNQIDIKVVPVTIDGATGSDSIVGRTAYSRAVPQMVRSEGGLIFVWTDVFDDVTKLVSVRMPLVKATPDS